MNNSDMATLIYLEALKTRREGMIAENQNRQCRGESLAYGEGEFYELEVEIRNLIEQGKPKVSRENMGKCIERINYWSKTSTGMSEKLARAFIKTMLEEAGVKIEEKEGEGEEAI